MGWTSVVQVVPSLLPRDAIGGHVLALRDGLRRRGIRSEIHCLATTAETAAQARPVEELWDRPVDGSTLVVYHLASGSELADELARRPGPLAVVSHNVTPPHLMAPWAPEVAHELLWARRQITDLARRADLGIGVSAFNAAELVASGYRRVAVAPVIVDRSRWAAPVGTGRAGRLDGLRVLFVGRVAPNKGHLELLEAVALLRATSCPHVHLHLVGSTEAVPAYAAAVRGMIATSGLERSVTIDDRLDDAGLAAAYAAADVLCCLSVHEGFAVPLVEAMAAGVPVVALAAAAVPETTAGAALLLHDAGPETVATALDRVRTDGDLRRSMAAAGIRRAARFDGEAAVDRFLAAIDQIAPVPARGAPR